MSFLSELKAFYPKSWKQRLAIQQYDGFHEWEEKEPITVTVHQVIQRYGGPEEGGWWFNQGLSRAHLLHLQQEAGDQNLHRSLRRVRSLGPAKSWIVNYRLQLGSQFCFRCSKALS
jgi:hypothetical protein